MECSRKSNAQWTAFRAVMFLSATTLALYIPYKYLTQLHAIEGIYAFLFPFSAVLALGGVLLAWKPERAHHLPVPVRAAVTLIAGGWIYTGVLCVPSLTQGILNHPMGGMFAAFHMLAQHAVLSASVGALVAAPRAMYAWFGIRAPETARESEILASENA